MPYDLSEVSRPPFARLERVEQGRVSPGQAVVAMAVVRSGAPYPLRRYRGARSSRKRLAAQGNGDLIPCQKCLAPRQIGDVGNVTALASSEDEQRFETSVPGASAFLATRSLLDVVAEQHEI